MILGIAINQFNLSAGTDQTSAKKSKKIKNSLMVVRAGLKLNTNEAVASENEEAGEKKKAGAGAPAFAFARCFPQFRNKDTEDFSSTDEKLSQQAEQDARAHVAAVASETKEAVVESPTHCLLLGRNNDKNNNDKNNSKSKRAKKSR